MSTASDVTQGLSVEKVTGWVGALQGWISRLFQKLRLPAAVTGMLAWCLVAMLAVALFAVVAAAALFWFMVTGKKDANDGQVGMDDDSAPEGCKPNILTDPGDRGAQIRAGSPMVDASIYERVDAEWKALTGHPDYWLHPAGDSDEAGYEPPPEWRN